MENENEFPEKFSDDAEEQLRIENEILRLKLKAELGGEIEGIDGTEGLPPEIENLFLKNILSFEHQYEKVETTTLYQIIHEPAYRKVASISDDEMDEALDSITELLKANNIAVDYRGEYSAREKYRFITEDLFNYETRLVQIDGMITHYSYEEFYPNHSLDIEDQTKEFIAHWFEMSFNEHSFELSDEFLTDTQQIVTKETVLKKFENMFAAYTAFEDMQFVIGTVDFQLDEANNTGLGNSEGAVKFTAILENGEKLLIDEPFKLYFHLVDNTWQIFFFYWPGFTW